MKIARRSAPSSAQIVWCLAALCAIWAVATWFPNANLDHYHDMLENYAWSQPLRWGTHKHPPFFGWTTGAWFALFPQDDLSYRFLSYFNVFVGLIGVWFLARRLKLGAAAPWAALLLLWTLPYTNLAAKFNANTQLLSIWPWGACLLLASWQETGWRRFWTSIGLGLVAAAAMLSKYYSGLFLAGLLVPALLHRDGRRWFSTWSPYLAVAVFALALVPHVIWSFANGWPTLTYAEEQGGGTVSWHYILHFGLAPLFYWLPAWLALCLVWAHVHARRSGASWLRTSGRFLVQSWLPRGRDDVLFWLAFMPWALSIGFALAELVALSTPWAIPIGYAYSVLWLRNLRQLAPEAEPQVLQRLARAWWPVAALVVVLAVVVAVVNARDGNAGYYRPEKVAAQTIVHDWHLRHPGQKLQWVGGDWAGNAMLAFYAQPHLLTVPGLPDSPEARMEQVGDWLHQNGVLLCLRGEVKGSTAPAPTDCDQQAAQWLAARGLSSTPHVVRAERSGWRFPHPRAWDYAVYDVDAVPQR
ncbi:MAG: glycosyltransferase family 39 protein [Burkholderiaceae bacterium]|nr:MAG: glycosyltransferase family 39 protein [Burkholderiaceae bacterium]